MGRAALSVTALTSVNGRVVGYNSPTDTLKDDIVVEGGTCNDTIGRINQICLVDSNGQERDCTTDLSYEDHTPDYVLIKGSIQASASYTVAKIRAYSGSKVYFETSYSVALNKGDILDVTYQITATVTCSLSGSVGQQKCNADGYIQNLLRKFIASSVTPATLCLKKAHLMYYNNNEGNYVSGLDIELSLSYDTSQNKVTGSGSGTSSLDFNAEYLMYDNGTTRAPPLIEQWFSQTLPIYKDTVVNMSYEFTVQ